jgi:hypothetical protein
MLGFPEPLGGRGPLSWPFAPFTNLEITSAVILKPAVGSSYVIAFARTANVNVFLFSNTSQGVVSLSALASYVGYLEPSLNTGSVGAVVGISSGVLLASTTGFSQVGLSSTANLTKILQPTPGAASLSSALSIQGIVGLKANYASAQLATALRLDGLKILKSSLGQSYTTSAVSLSAAKPLSKTAGYADARAFRRMPVSAIRSKRAI